MISDQQIDGGKGFDWGKTSADYAKYRDIYPPEFYRKILDAGLCVAGQNVLDLGTGTGVLPRNLYRYGAHFVGTDISQNQIEQAKELASSAHMDIEFQCAPAEESNFPDGSFDVVTACQCFWYFNHPVLAPTLFRILKPGGRFAVLFMAWLPREDKIAGETEKLVLKFNPAWNGCGLTRDSFAVPAMQAYEKYFEIENDLRFDVRVPFTRESWNGRIRACRGTGASLDEKTLEQFNREHVDLLQSIAPEKFDIPHYCVIRILRSKKTV